MQIIVARPGNVYGPGDRVDRGRAIPTFIQNALANKDITIMGDGRQEKAFLYIDDLVTVLLMLVSDHPNAGSVNIVGSRYISIKALAEMIIKMTGSKSRIVFQDAGQAGFETVRISTDKLNALFSPVEKISLEDGLERTIEAFRKNY